MLQDIAMWLGLLGALCALAAGTGLLTWACAELICIVWEKLHAGTGADRR